MNAPHIHLMVNHIPVILVPVGLALLLAGWRRASRDLLAASLWVFLAGGVSAAVAAATGDMAAGDLVRMVPGISLPAISAHEESAEAAGIGAGILGVLALAGLVRFGVRRRIPRWFILLALVGALAVSGLMARTANLGGEIRHTEMNTPSAGK